MKTLWCDCCGDIVNAVCLCKFVFHTGLEKGFNICLDCMETGTLKINLSRQKQVAEILSRFKARRVWRKRSGCS